MHGGLAGHQSKLHLNRSSQPVRLGQRDSVVMRLMGWGRWEPIPALPLKDGGVARDL